MRERKKGTDAEMSEREREDRSGHDKWEGRKGFEVEVGLGLQAA